MAATVYTPISQLVPDQRRVNVRAKVVSQLMLGETRHEGGCTIRVAEFLIADTTASIVLKALQDQIIKIQSSKYVTLHNARIDMFRGAMRILVDEGFRGADVTGGEILESNWSEDEDDKVNLEKNMSLMEWEFVASFKPVIEGKSYEAEGE